MKQILPLFILLLALCSCVSKAEYEALENELREKNNTITDLQNEIVDVKLERDEIKYTADELQESLDELKNEVFYMQKAMQEAHDNYYFYGATDFFTRCAIDELKKYY